MSEFTEALTHLIKVIRRKTGDRYLSNLRPGLTYNQIEELVKDLPIKFPLEFYELYRWRNGCKKESIENSLQHLPLEMAVEKYLAKQKYYDPSMPEDYLASPNWFQLYPWDVQRLETGYFVIDKIYNRASIIFMDAKEPECITREYASLTSMMLTIAKCIEKVVPSSPNYFDESYQIWRKYNSSIIDEVLAKLENNWPSEIIRTAIMRNFQVANCLARYKDVRIVELLIRVLELPIPGYTTLAITEEYIENMEYNRWLAINFLGEHGGIKAVEQLIYVLQDRDNYTRLQAIKSLQKLKDKRAIQPLIELLQDSDQEVRLEAVRSLQRLKDKRVIQPLIELLQDSDQEVRLETVSSLVYLRAVYALIIALKHDNACIRWGAALALRRIKDPRAVEPLLQLIDDDEDSSVRKMAREALKNLDLEYDIPALEGLFTIEDL